MRVVLPVVVVHRAGAVAVVSSAELPGQRQLD
jgi:hypothetical protein